MDPLTMMAIAQVAVSGVQLVQNYFAGQDQIAQQKKRQEASYKLQRKQIDQQGKQIAEQVTQGQTDIAAAASGDAAALASRGIEGGFVDLAVGANKNDRTNKLDLWKTNALTTLDNSLMGLDMGFQNAMQDLTAQSDQLNMDALMGGLGIGLSAAGTLVDSGVFNQKPVDIFANNGGGDFVQDYSWTGGRPTKTKLHGPLAPSL